MATIICQWVSQVIFFVACYVSGAAVIQQQNEVSLIGMAVIAVLSLILTYFRRHSKMLASLVIHHVYFGAIVIMANFCYWNIPSLRIMTFIVVVFSFLMRIIPFMQRMECVDKVRFVILLVLYVVVDISKFDKVEPIIFWLALSYLVLMLYDRNLRSVEEYISSNQNSTALSRQRMRRDVGKETAKFVGIIGILIIACTRISYRYLYTVVKKILYAIGAFIVRFLGKPSDDNNGEWGELIQEQADGVMGKENIWYEIIMNVLFALIFIGILIFIIRLLYKKFYQKKQVFQISSSEEPQDVHEKLVVRKKKVVKMEKETNSNKIIRKRYKRRMKGFWFNNVTCNKEKTPEEQRQLKNKSGDYVEEGVVTLYEKARYSNETITKNDIRTMNQLMKLK